MKARKQGKKKRWRMEEGMGEGKRRPISSSLAGLKEVNRTDHAETLIAGKKSAVTI